jgi:hypothetical protein
VAGVAGPEAPVAAVSLLLLLLLLRIAKPAFSCNAASLVANEAGFSTSSVSPKSLADSAWSFAKLSPLICLATPSQLLFSDSAAASALSSIDEMTLTSARICWLID